MRENRLRRMAERQGLRLHKSRRRDPRALDYDHWWIENETTGAVSGIGASGRPEFRLDDVEAYLTGEPWQAKGGES